MSLGSILRPQKGRAPVPATLPGDFFVLEYNREEEAFTLHVDDGDHSTYDLGNDVAELQVIFRKCWVPKSPEELQQQPVPATRPQLQPQQIDRMIDIARELGMAQYIPHPGELVEDRVLSILPRSALHQELNFDGQEEGNWLHGIR